MDEDEAIVILVVVLVAAFHIMAAASMYTSFEEDAYGAPTQGEPEITDRES